MLTISVGERGSLTLPSSASGTLQRNPARKAEPVSPEQLMCAFLDGDARAFETLFRELAPRVASALTRMSGDRRLAEDLTQNVFLKLYRARDSYQRGVTLTPWVFAIARNLYFDHMRRVRRRPEQLSEDGNLPELAHAGEVSHIEDPALRESLERLPASQRRVLLLLKVEGLSVAETAALCGTSPASIKMRAHRAYAALRDILSRRTQP